MLPSRLSAIWGAMQENEHQWHFFMLCAVLPYFRRKQQEAAAFEQHHRRVWHRFIGVLMYAQPLNTLTMQDCGLLHREGAGWWAGCEHKPAQQRLKTYIGMRLGVAVAQPPRQEELRDVEMGRA